MDKIITILLALTFLFPVTSFSHDDDPHEEHEEHQEEDGSSSGAGVALLVLGAGYLIYNSNVFQGMKAEKKAEFINDLNKGKGMKIKGFDSGVSIYLLPNSKRINERFENNLNFSESGFKTRPNILSLEYNF